MIATSSNKSYMDGGDTQLQIVACKRSIVTGMRVMVAANSPFPITFATFDIKCRHNSV